MTRIPTQFLSVFIICALISACGEDTQEANTANMAGEESMAGEEVIDPMIGAPEGENISITHEVAIESIRNNLSLHIDEIDTALDMLEDSRVVDNIAELFSDDEDEDEETSGNPEDHDEEVLEIDLSDLRDTLIEILTEDMLSESSLSIDEESNILTYQIVPEIVCANDEEEEGETTPEERQEELQDYQDCLRRIEANPVTIQVSANGDQKLNLSITVADQSDALRIQIHDDLIAGFIPLQFVKSFIKAFVDEEDLEMPDTMTGLIGLEARRIDAAHFNLRMAILQRISSVNYVNDQMRLGNIPLGKILIHHLGISF